MVQPAGLTPDIEEKPNQYLPHKHFSLSKSCPLAYQKAYELAKALPPEECLKEANVLQKKSDVGSLHYWEAIITNPAADSHIRDKAVLKYSKYTEVLLKSGFKNSWWNAENLRFQYAKYLKILCSKNKVDEKDRHKAYLLLGVYYNPMEHKHEYVSAAQSEEFFIKALSYNQCKPSLKAHILNDLGALYHNDYFGRSDDNLKKACDYYKKIEDDETLPLENRLDAKLMRVRVLAAMSNEKETIQERITLINSLMSHPDISQDLLQKSQVMHHYLRLIEADYASLPEEKCKAILLENSEALKKLFQHAKLDSETDAFARTAYAGALHELIFIYRDSQYKKRELLDILADLMDKEAGLLPDIRAKVILWVADIMRETKQNMSEILKDRKIRVLLDNICGDFNIYPFLKNEAGIRKILLTARNMIPTPLNSNKKQELISEMLLALNDSTVQNSVRISVLKESSAFIQSTYKNHNKTVEKIVSLLKETLKTEKTVNNVYQIKFILYSYYQAYGESIISDEQARDYVLDLSQKDVPDALRIRLIEEDESSSTEEDVSLSEPKVEKEPDRELHQDAVVPNIGAPISTQMPDNGEGPLAAAPTPPISVVAAPLNPQHSKATVVNVGQASGEKTQKQRNREKAERLLEVLQSKHGKVTQQEVTNMLRRLEYTFQPTQDNGLTIHLAHRARNNKKGTPGVLNKGQKHSLASVLQDALNQ